MKPWIGLHLPLYTYPNTSSAELFDKVVEQAQAAEANGRSGPTDGSSPSVR